MEKFVRDLAGRLNLKHKGNILFGKYNGFYLRIEAFNESYYSLLVSAFSLESKGEIYEYLEQAKQKDIIDEYAIKKWALLAFI